MLFLELNYKRVYINEDVWRQTHSISKVYSLFIHLNAMTAMFLGSLKGRESFNIHSIFDGKSNVRGMNFILLSRGKIGESNFGGLACRDNSMSNSSSGRDVS